MSVVVVIYEVINWLPAGVFHEHAWHHPPSGYAGSQRRLLLLKCCNGSTGQLVSTAARHLLTLKGQHGLARQVGHMNLNKGAKDTQVV
jgi:hypothetical protein